MNSRRFNFSAYSLEEAKLIINSGKCDELILHCETFSKKGRIALHQMDEILSFTKKSDGQLVFQWDIIENQVDIQNHHQLVREYPWFGRFPIRFLDPGVGLLLIESNPEIQVQQILDKIAYNSRSILAWEKQFTPQINRIVLSNELPITELKVLAKEVKTPLEVQVAGPIETFYSPRPLLSAKDANNGLYTRFEIESEDRPGSWLNTIETEQGVTIDHEKELMLLDDLKELETAGVYHYLIDLYLKKNLEAFRMSLLTDQWVVELQNRWAGKTTRGFFKSNKTDAPFKRLSNPFLQQKDNKVGEVLEYEKPEHLIIEFYETIQLPVELKVLSPEGKEANLQLESAVRLKDNTYVEIVHPGIFKTRWVKHAVPTSLILQQNKV